MAGFELDFASTCAVASDREFDEDMARLHAAREILAIEKVKQESQDYLEQERTILLRNRGKVARAINRLQGMLDRLDADLNSLDELEDELSLGYVPRKPR